MSFGTIFARRRTSSIIAWSIFRIHLKYLFQDIRLLQHLAVVDDHFSMNNEFQLSMIRTEQSEILDEHGALEKIIFNIKRNNSKTYKYIFFNNSEDANKKLTTSEK